MREINTFAQKEQIVLDRLSEWVNIQELISLEGNIDEVYKILGKLLMQGCSFEVRANENAWEGEIKVKGKE